MPVLNPRPPEFEAIKKALKQLPAQAAAEAESFFRDGFDKQGWQGDNGLEPWEKRKRDKSKRLILVGKGSGQLRKNLRKFVTGNNIGVKVTGTPAKYADAHNFGETINIPVTKKMRSFAWAMYYKAGGNRYKAAGKTMGERSSWSAGAVNDITFWKWLALTKKKTLKIKMPKRQFIGNSKQLTDRLLKLFETKISAAGNAAPGP